MKKILEAIAGHQIKGVRLSLPDGTSVAVDQISARDLDHLLARLDKSLDGADGHGNVE